MDIASLSDTIRAIPLPVTAAVCFGVAWFTMLLVGRPLIAWLKQLRGTQWSPREDTPDSHLVKAGTPSMGGIGLIGAALATSVAVVFPLVLFLQVAEAQAISPGSSILDQPNHELVRLHHHFELAGWSEWRVVGAFWLINAVTSALGVFLWVHGYLPRFA